MPLIITRGALAAQGFGFSGNTSPVSQQAFTTAGTFSWVVPANVRYISVVAVGGGGGGAGGWVLVGDPGYYGGPAGGGGATAYVNNVLVYAGETLTVVVGSGGAGGAGVSGIAPVNLAVNGVSGGSSYLARGGTKLVEVGGGVAGNRNADSGYTAGGGTGGAVVIGTGGSGGNGSLSSTAGAGGGAGGYSGNGGGERTAGAGGGGGGGANGVTQSVYQRSGSSGGGVGLLGEGSNGAAG